MRRDRLETPGVPLAHYVEHHPGTGMLFTCMGCMYAHAVPMDRILARLRETGGGEQTGIKTLGLKATARCPRCGEVFWDSSPAW